jgi:tetratricopeptide (TPR) repeat protein
MNVVVLAYGPAPLTKRAVHRARKLAGSRATILTVPASPAAHEAVAAATGTRKTEQTGRHGLATALETLDESPVLLLHDDVVLTAKGLAAMRHRLDSGSRFVIPYTNDPATDHFVGPLPAAKEAERRLDQTPLPTRTITAAAVKPVCLLTGAADLRTLLLEPLADPYAVLDLSGRDVAVAAGALAAHSTDCVGRLVDPAADTAPLLVASLIVRNEEEMLPGCLASLDGVVDRIEICDTGSTDATIAIARDAGATVIERAWSDDFSAARNHALEQCRDARYVLWIDADERVTCPDPVQLRRYLATYAAEHPAFALNITNVDASGSEQYSFTTVRLFHADDTEFRGQLHEAVHIKGATEPLAGQRLEQLGLIHHGYDSGVIADRAKTQRNLELAEQQHVAAGDARSAVQLARSLSYAGEAPERALQLLEEALTEAPAASPATRAQILNLMADRCIVLGDAQRAFELSRESLQLVPADDTAAAVFADAAMRLGRHEEIIEAAALIDAAAFPRPVVTVDHNRDVFRTHLVAAYAHTDRTEQAVAAAFELLAECPEQFGAWAPLVACLHRHYKEAAVELLAPLAAKDSSGLFLEPLINTFPPAALADFAVAYAGAAGTVAEVFRVGLLAAAMAGYDEAFHALAPAADKLDPLVRIGLADRISGQGRPDLAAELQKQPVVLRL